MARIRTIKPEFQNSQSMGRVSRDARLTFIELWPQCDDSGRIRANSRMLASVLFPYDEDAPKLIDGWLAELENEACIVRYKHDGNEYIAICHWDHQKIDHPKASTLPPPPAKKRCRSKAAPREASREIDEDDTKDRAVSSTVPEGKGGEGNVSLACANALAKTDFEKFYHAFPRKIGRRPAEKAFKAAVKRGADPSVILKAAIAYATSRIGHDERFTPHPATWLNRDGWLDDLENHHDRRRPEGKGIREAVELAFDALQRDEGRDAEPAGNDGRGEVVELRALPPAAGDERGNPAPLGRPGCGLSFAADDDAGEIPEIPAFLRRTAHVS